MFFLIIRKTMNVYDNKIKNYCKLYFTLETLKYNIQFYMFIMKPKDSNDKLV